MLTIDLRERVEHVSNAREFLSRFPDRLSARALEVVETIPIVGVDDANASARENRGDDSREGFFRWIDGEICRHFRDCFLGTREIGAYDARGTALEPTGDVESRNLTERERVGDDGAVRVGYDARAFVERKRYAARRFVAVDGRCDGFGAVSHRTKRQGGGYSLRLARRDGFPRAGGSDEFVSSEFHPTQRAVLVAA